MTDLIACLSSGKGTWAHVARLIKEENWDKILLITNQFGKENFKPDKESDFIVVDFNKHVFGLIEDIKKGIEGKTTDMEVGLNLVSGNGKEHMAILSAIIQLGLGIRMVAVTSEGVKEI
jgi:hypothetical protein